MAIEVNDLITNIMNHSVKEFGAHNTSSPFSYLAGSNLGSVADTMSSSIPDESDKGESIKWATKEFTYLPGIEGWQPAYRHDGVKFARRAGERYCLVQFRYYNAYINKPFPYPPSAEKGGIAYGFILLSTDSSIKSVDEYYGSVQPYSAIRESTQSIETFTTAYSGGSANRDLLKTTFSGFYAQVRTNSKYLLETKTYFEALNNSLIGNLDGLYAYLGTPSATFDGIYDAGVNGYNNATVRSLLSVASDIPVFDISNYQDIVKYILNEEIENPLSPEDFSPSTPDVEAGFQIDNYATTWDIYLTAGDGNGRAVITASCEAASSLGADGVKKIKTVYSVDPKTSYLFDSKYTYQEKQYGSAFGVNLSDIARNEGGSAWLDSNNDPKGNHTLYGMLYSGGGNSIAFSFEWFFTPTANIGISIVESNAVKFWKSAISPAGSFVIQSTSMETTAFGFKYTDLYGDVVNVHVNESYTEENDVYNPDRGNQYNPIVDTYGEIDTSAHSLIGKFYTYKLTQQQMKTIFEQFNTISPTIFLSAIWGGSLWNCIKSMKYIPINNNISHGLHTFTPGNVTVGEAQYVTVSPAIILDCGTISNISRKYNNFLDYNPYTQFYIHLPYVGYVNLPVDEVYNCTLSFKLAIDYISGEAVYYISRNGCIRWTYSCTLGADIPLDTSNNGTAFVRGLGSAFGVSGVANLSLDYAAQVYDKSIRIDSASGFDIQRDSPSIFYLLEYPKAQLPTSSPHDNGRPCGLTKTLSSLKGFTKCKNVDVTGYSCTDAERNELISILESGIYL